MDTAEQAQRLVTLAVYEQDCLRDLAQFCENQTKMRKQQRKQQRKNMGHIKNYLHEVSDDLGFDGEITDAVLVEAKRRLNCVLTCDGWCEPKQQSTYMDHKGYTYCGPCAIRRHESGYRVRRLTNAELSDLQMGVPVAAFYLA